MDIDQVNRVGAGKQFKGRLYIPQGGEKEGDTAPGIDLIAPFLNSGDGLGCHLVIGKAPGEDPDIMAAPDQTGRLFI